MILGHSQSCKPLQLLDKRQFKDVFPIGKVQNNYTIGLTIIYESGILSNVQDTYGTDLESKEVMKDISFDSTIVLFIKDSKYLIQNQ